MKILTISNKDVFKKDPAELKAYIQEKLKEAGFNLTRPIKPELLSDSWVYKQEDDPEVCAIDPHSSCEGIIPNDYCEDCETPCCTMAELKSSAKEQYKEDGKRIGAKVKWVEINDKKS